MKHLTGKILIIFLLLAGISYAGNVVNMFNINYMVESGNFAGKTGGSPKQLLRGREFEKTVLRERNLIKNNSKIGNSIPDSIKGGRITEIKDVKYIYRSKQFRDYLYKAGGRPVDLIVSPRSTISRPLIRGIRDSYGKILVRIGKNRYIPYIR